MTENKDFEYFKNKRTDRLYLSKSLDAKIPYKDENGEIKELIKPFRIISKVIDGSEAHVFIKEGKQVSLRITDGERHEITAKFYEDSRGIYTLQIQKYTMATVSPHNTHFTFIGDEILKLHNFIRNISLIPIQSKESAKLDDKFVEEIVLTKEQAIKLINENHELITEIINSEVTPQDISNLNHRKKQLEKFEKLLTDTTYFESVRSELGSNKGKESVWQNFFEENTWIFGYGLNYVFNSPLQDAKLEQVVSGYNFNSSGKRIDALMKTRGLINSFCFGEIKVHDTPLLKQVKDPYRGECWAVSDELAGAIAQTQKTVQKAIKDLATKIEVKDDKGNLTGEQVFLYQPKSFVVVGSLAEFKNEHGINEDKFSSFELYRQNLFNPEIITFDELYERAKYIVASGIDS